MAPSSDDEKVMGGPSGEETDANTVVDDKETAVEPSRLSSEKKLEHVESREKGKDGQSQDEDFDIEGQEVSLLGLHEFGKDHILMLSN